MMPGMNPTSMSNRMLKNLPAAFSHRSEAQRTEAYASSLRSLRPCWTAYFDIGTIWKISLAFVDKLSFPTTS